MATRPRIVYFGFQGLVRLPWRPWAAVLILQAHMRACSCTRHLPPLPPRRRHWLRAGRAEPLRMALAAAGVEFDFEEVDTQQLKSNVQAFHFGQVPR